MANVSQFEWFTIGPAVTFDPHATFGQRMAGEISSRYRYSRCSLKNSYSSLCASSDSGTKRVRFCM
jgi:hypothetical protein